MSCGVGRRCGSDLTLLWPWGRSAAAALIQPLAWEPPYATGVAQEKAKRQKQKQNITKLDPNLFPALQGHKTTTSGYILHWTYKNFTPFQFPTS